MKRPIPYSETELAWIRANCALPQREAHALFINRFGRNDVSYENYRALCKRKRWLTGRTGHFERGHAPMNKGKKMPFNPNSAKTQFKKGSQPHNTKFEGHERETDDGYIMVSVPETNPHTGFERCYVLKHKWLWEQMNGPVPEGHVLKCLDGNRQNCDPDNWEAIPRGMLPRLSGRWRVGYDAAPDELKPVIMTTARLKHQARERRKS